MAGGYNWHDYVTPEMQRVARRFRYHVRTAKNPRGRIVRMPCVFCGNEKSEAHHPDYTKWWLVSWLCLSHHRQVDHGSLKLCRKHLFDYSSLVIQKHSLQREGPVQRRTLREPGEDDDVFTVADVQAPVDPEVPF